MFFRLIPLHAARPVRAGRRFVARKRPAGWIAAGCAVALCLAVFGGAAADERVVDSVLDPRLAGTTLDEGEEPTTGARPRETIGVQIADGGVGVLRTGEIIRLADALPAERDDGSIYIDLADAEHIVPLADADAPVVREAAEEFAFVDNPEILSAAFRAETAGRRTVWARVREGTDELNRRFWTQNVSQSWLRSEAAPDKKDRWHWLELGERHVSATDHRFLTRHHGRDYVALGQARRGDFHFDRLAYLPEGTQPPDDDDRGPAMRTVRADHGTIETRDLTPPAMRELVRLELRGVDDEVIEAREVSLDGGESWIDAPDGDLDHIELAGDGSDTLRFRATFSRLADGASPTLRGIDLVVAPDPEAWLVVRNDFMRIIADAATGRLFRLTDLRHGRELIWPAEPTPIFAADLKEPGEREWLRYSDHQSQVVSVADEVGPTTAAEQAEALLPERADELSGASADPARLVKAEAADGAIELHYTVEDDVHLHFSLGLDRSAQAIWSADVRNDHAVLDLIRLQFPRLEMIRVGPDGMAMTAFRPQNFGHERRAPGLMTLRDAKYPGAVAMPWEAIYDDHGGLGLIARDPEAHGVGFESDVDDFFQHTFSLALRKFDNVAAAGGTASWEYGVVVFPDRWHYVADRYRAWAEDHLQPARYPDWFETNDGFINVQMGQRGRAFTEMDDLIDRARYFGLEHIQIWGQFSGHIGRGGTCCEPYHMPSPIFGTSDDFREGNRRIDDAGMRVGYYFLPDRVNLYDARGSHIHGFIAKDDYEAGTEFPEHAFFEQVQWVGHPDGETRVYPLSDAQWAEYERQVGAFQEDPTTGAPPKQWHPVDLSDPDWHAYTARWAVDKYVEQWAAHGHYFDVIGTGQVRESFDARKGHHGHGHLGPARADVARTTLERAHDRGHDDYFLLVEGMMDLAGQWAAPMISGLYHLHSESMRYTFPDRVLFEGHSNRGHLRPLQSLAHAYLNGNRFDVTGSAHTVSKIVNLRARTRDWIYRSRFMDTIGIIDSPVPARLFLRREAGAIGAAVNFLNADRTSGEIRLDADRVGDIAHAIGFDYHGRTFAVPLERDGGEVRFDVPETYLATVILVEEAELDHGLVGGVHLRRGSEDEEARIVVTLANLTDATVAGSLRPKQFEPFAWPADDPTFEVEPGDITRVAVPVEPGDAFWRFAPLHVDVHVDGDDVLAVHNNAFPLVSDPTFEHTGNDEAERAKGSRSLRLDPAEGQYHERIPLHLEPGRRYRISLAYKRTEGESRLSAAQVWQRLGPQDERNNQPLSFRTDGEWDRVEAVFDSADRFYSTTLYLYNWESDRTLWIDDIRVEDLGPID